MKPSKIFETPEASGFAEVGKTDEKKYTQWDMDNDGAYEQRKPSENPSFYRTIMDSPQWQAWVKHNEETPQYDVHESMELNWFSQNHWQAFIKWVKEN